MPLTNDSPCHRPLVSVWLITYNHAAYIAAAIEGVLQQQTSFEVEIIIGDDCSTDGTRAIVQDYQRRYPDRIQLFLPEQNMGMVPILRPTYALCRGKYVAMLDGDDYWTDPLKLQKQADLLEREPEAQFCFHRVSVLHAATSQLVEADEPPGANLACHLDLADFVRCNVAPALSVLFRNIGPLPDWYYRLPYPDYAMHLLQLLQGGTAYYLPDNMGVYRIHEQGCFSSLSSERHTTYAIEFLEGIRPHLPGQHHDYVTHEVEHMRYNLMRFHLRKLRLSKAVGQWRQLGTYPADGLSHRVQGKVHEWGLSVLKSLARLLSKPLPAAKDL